MSDDLANYKLQLQQVEAALLGEPDNEELIKLKTDLFEIITLQEELLAESIGGDVGNSKGNASSSGSFVLVDRVWKVGDRVLAPTTNGQHYPAVIDGISGDSIAITFVGNGRKDMVRRTDLKEAPVEVKKTYVFDSDKQQKQQYNKKNEWQAERERRKLRAQKKEMKRKELDSAKEGEKMKWHAFNNKANSKGLKGLKRVEATSSSSDTVGKRDNLVSSRRDLGNFARSQRGAMDSLF